MCVCYFRAGCAIWEKEHSDEETSLPKPFTPQGLLKKWKEDQCDFGGEGCEKMKLGSAGDMTSFGGHCKPAKEFRCDSEDKRG